MIKHLFTLLAVFLGFSLSAQLVNNGATIVVESGATLVVEGSITNGTGGIITNDGTIEVQGDLEHNGTSFTNNSGSLLKFTGNTPTAVTGLDITADDVEINKVNQDVTLGVNLNINGDLAFNASNTGHFILGSNNITLTGGLTGASTSTGYVITDGAGELRKTSLGVTAFTYPIGNDDMTYNPVTISNSGTAATVGARVIDRAYEEGSTTTTPIATGTVDASWVVSGGAAGDLTMEFQWDGTDEQSGFDNQNSGISQHNGSYWDLTLDRLDAASGADPYTMTTMATMGGPGVFTVGGKEVMDFAMVTPKIVLSGPYNGATSGALMNTNLTSVLPTGEPYALMTGFTHSGIGGGEIAAGFTNVVDWVFVEIRSDANTVIGTQSALLLNDGSIVGPALGAMKMYGVKSGATSPGYYFAVKHRNHLGVMTAGLTGAGTLSQSVVADVDFTGGSAYGVDALMNNGNGVFTLYGGEVTGDGTILINDVNSLIGAFNGTGYIIQDITLDGTVLINDINFGIANFNKSQQF